MEKVCDNSARCNPRLRRFVRPPWCRERVIQDMGTDTLTSTSEADNSDINIIVERFKRTGILPEAKRQAQYGDCTHLQKDLTTLVEEARHTERVANEFAANWKPKPEEPLTAPSSTNSAPVSTPAEPPPSQ